MGGFHRQSVPPSKRCQAHYSRCANQCQGSDRKLCQDQRERSAASAIGCSSLPLIAIGNSLSRCHQRLKVKHQRQNRQMLPYLGPQLLDRGIFSNTRRIVWVSKLHRT